MTARRTVTITEIARRAGVNKSTVSRALSGSSEVGGDTVARIRAIAEDLGYMRDHAAASLRTGRSAALGVLVPRVTDYVLASIYEGVTQVAHAAGYATLVSDTEDDPELRMSQLQTLLARRVEGFVICDARLDGDEVVATLERRRHPYVLANRRLHGQPGVTTDDVAGGRMAGLHLHELGHRRVGVLAGPEFTSTGVERAFGFSDAFRSQGVATDPNLVVSSSNSADGGYAAMRELLAREPGITGVFATNDFAAIGAMGAARQAGRQVGIDLAIIGYNDIPLAQYLPIPLTTVRSATVRMGEQAARQLLELITDEHSDRGASLLGPHLVVRESTMRV